MAADIAVVIGNHEGEDVLRDCLASLTEQTRAVREVLVVDGASSDRSREVADEFGARFVAAENRGLGHLYNLGARSTGCEYVLLSNNDVAYSPRCIELLAAALDEDERRFAADPTQLGWNDDRVIHARTILTRGRWTGEYFPGLHLDDNVPADRTVPTVSAHGAAMLVRRALLLELGGFDESFFMEWEDLDLCWRAWAEGRPSVYVPSARLRHRVGAVTGAHVMQRRRASSQHNLIRFALKCLPAAPAARVVGGTLLRLPRHPRSILTGLGRVVVELPQIAAARRAVPAKEDLFLRLLAFD